MPLLETALKTGLDEAQACFPSQVVPARGPVRFHPAREKGEELLIASAIGGDTAAFGELSLRHRADAVMAARSIVGGFFAEDVAQDAMLLAFKSLRTLKDPSKFSPWLRAIVRRLAMRVRNSKYAEAAHHSDEDPAEAASPAAGEPEAEDLLSELVAGLEHIPSDYAQVLRLHFLEGIPLEQIGGTLGVPVSTVKWRIHKGKKVLREQLEGQAEPVEGGLEWLDSALRLIPPDSTALLLEHCVEGVPLSQIASDRGVSVPSVERRLELGRKALRERLIQVGQERGRAGGKRQFRIPCETCPVPRACLTSACAFTRGASGRPGQRESSAGTRQFTAPGAVGDAPGRSGTRAPRERPAGTGPLEGPRVLPRPPGQLHGPQVSA